MHSFCLKKLAFRIEVSAISVSLGLLGLLANTVDRSNFAAEIRQYHAHPISIYQKPVFGSICFEETADDQLEAH